MTRFQDAFTQNRPLRWVADRVVPFRREIRCAYETSRQLEKSPLTRIEVYQTRRLGSLLEAANRSPYYRDVIAATGIAPKRFRLSDLARLPFLTKTIIRDEQDRLRIPGARQVYENYSGGSTGSPVRFEQDYRYKVHMSVATRRSNELAGAFPGARVAKLWGAPQDKRKIEGPWGRAKLWLLNQRYFDTFDMAPERMLDYHRELQQFQPDLIQAYASSLFLFARFLRSRGIRPDYPRVGMISAAEKLYPHMRREIEEVFPAQVFDRYGSREISAMAAECGEHNGLHVQMPGYIVETIDPRSGANVLDEPGEIVVTVLNNYAMPFLRYRIGDMGVLTKEPCRCGSSFIRLREITGRTTDNFLMPDGRIVHGEYFTHIFYGRDGIEQFQFVQEAIDRFRLRIVPAPGYTRDLGAAVEREIREVIGERSELHTEVREEIPKTSSGKYRFTISHVGMEQLVGEGRQ